MTISNKLYVFSLIFFVLLCGVVVYLLKSTAGDVESSGESAQIERSRTIDTRPANATAPERRVINSPAAASGPTTQQASEATRPFDPRRPKSKKLKNPHEYLEEDYDPDLLPVEKEYFPIESYMNMICASAVDIDRLEKHAFWSPEDKKLTDEARARLLEMLTIEHRELSGMSKNYYVKLNELAARERSEGKLGGPQNPSEVDTTKRPGVDKVVMSQNQVYEVMPRHHPELQILWTDKLQKTINISNKIRWFFQDLR